MICSWENIIHFACYKTSATTTTTATRTTYPNFVLSLFRTNLRKPLQTFFVAAISKYLDMSSLCCILSLLHSNIKSSDNENETKATKQTKSEPVSFANAKLPCKKLVLLSLMCAVICNSNNNDNNKHMTKTANDYKCHKKPIHLSPLLLLPFSPPLSPTCTPNMSSILIHLISSLLTYCNK